jgi:hypothetical protein
MVILTLWSHLCAGERAGRLELPALPWRLQLQQLPQGEPPPASALPVPASLLCHCHLGSLSKKPLHATLQAQGSCTARVLSG